MNLLDRTIKQRASFQERFHVELCGKVMKRNTHNYKGNVSDASESDWSDAVESFSLTEKCWRPLPCLARTPHHQSNYKWIKCMMWYLFTNEKWLACLHFAAVVKK